MYFIDHVSVCSRNLNLKERSDEEIADLVLCNKVKDHELETRLESHRAVTVRRLAFSQKLKWLPSTNQECSTSSRVNRRSRQL
jgi:hypothetical protein